MVAPDGFKEVEAAIRFGRTSQRMSRRFSRKQRDRRVCDGLFIGCLDDTFHPDAPASGNEHDEYKKQWDDGVNVFGTQLHDDQ